MKNNIIFLLSYVCLIGISCSDNKSPSIPVVQASSMDKYCTSVIDTFLNQLKLKDSNAINNFLPSDGSVSDSAIYALRNSTIRMNQLSGNFLEHKLIKKRFILDDIAAYSYLMKYERKFYRAVFIFYKPIDKPKIYKFDLEEGFEIELQESLKLYMFE